MDEYLLYDLISQGENEGLDFKSELNLDSDAAKAEFIKDVISIANSAIKGRNFIGYLLIGIADNGNVIGIDNIEEERIHQIVHRYIRPVVKLDCSLIYSSKNGVSIGVIKITGENRPYSVVGPISKLNQDDIFVRQGSITTKASTDEILGMHNEMEDHKFVSRYFKAANSHFKLERYEDALISINEAIKILAYYGKFPFSCEGFFQIIRY